MPLVIQPLQTQTSPQLQGQPQASAPNPTAYTAQAFGDIANRLQEAQNRIQSRTDAIELARDDNLFYEATNAELTKRSTERDFSRPTEVSEFASHIDTGIEDIVSKHAGSADSQARLRVQLLQRKNAFINQASGISLSAQKAHVERFITRHTNAISADVQNYPGTIAEALGRVDAVIGSQKDALTYGEQIEASNRAKARLVQDAVGTLALRPDGIAAASDLLNHPLFDELIDPKDRENLSSFIRSQKDEFKRALEGGAGGKPVNGTPGAFGTDDVKNIIDIVATKFEEGTATRQELLQYEQAYNKEYLSRKETVDDTGRRVLQYPETPPSHKKRIYEQIVGQINSPSFRKRASDQQPAGAPGQPAAQPVGRRATDAAPQGGSPRGGAAGKPEAEFQGDDQANLQEILRIRDPKERIAAFEAFTTNRVPVDTADARQGGAQGGAQGQLPIQSREADKQIPSTPERDVAIQSLAKKTKPDPKDSDDAFYDNHENTTYGQIDLIYGPINWIVGTAEERLFPFETQAGKAIINAKNQAEVNRRDLIRALTNTRAYGEQKQLEEKFGLEGGFWKSESGGRAKALGIGAALQREYRENLAKSEDKTLHKDVTNKAREVAGIIKTYIRKTYGYLVENQEDMDKVPPGSQLIDITANKKHPSYGRVVTKK